jgi:peptidoglycan/LPS O-acetylase OafA/YrhL
VLLILGVLGSERAGALLASAAGRLLGRLSFPVYLFHFPLLCSLTCWLFLAVRPWFGHDAAVALAGLGTVPALLAVGYGFARVDELWVAQLSTVARKAIVVPDGGGLEANRFTRGLDGRCGGADELPRRDGRLRPAGTVGPGGA